MAYMYCTRQCCQIIRKYRVAESGGNPSILTASQPRKTPAGRGTRLSRQLYLPVPDILALMD